jgi:hypothetical protein
MPNGSGTERLSDHWGARLATVVDDGWTDAARDGTTPEGDADEVVAVGWLAPAVGS